MVTIFWRRKTHLVWKKSGKIKNKYSPSDRRIVLKWDFLCTLGLGLSALVVQCTVGWSDLALLAIFENGHYAANQIYFYESNSKKGEICSSRQRKITGVLKIDIFVWKCANILILLQRTIEKKKNLEISLVSYFYRPPKLAKLA